jgi:integrase
MARIVKVTDGNPRKPYEVRWSWYDGTTRRRFKKERFRTEREAKAKKREVEADVAEGNVPDYAARRSSFGTWAERWYANKAATRKPTTVRGYRALLDGSVLPVFGSARVGTITTADVEDWAATLVGRGLAPSTIRNNVGVLSGVLKYATRNGAIKTNPARDAELLTERASGRHRPLPRFLTSDEVGALAGYLGEHHAPTGLLVRFTAYTGLRAGEVAGVNIGDLDLLRREMHVKRSRTKVKGEWTEHSTKSGNARHVPLPPWLVDDLAAYLTTHPNRFDRDAPLWPGRKHAPAHGGLRGTVDWSQPWSSSVFGRRAWQEAFAATGIERCRFHDLRHTYVSLMAQQGVAIHKVQKYVGHADPWITENVYLHLYPSDAQDDAARLVRPATRSAQ